MLWLSLALAFLGSLAFVAWRDWLKLKQPLPPHEQLVARVKSLEDKMTAVMAHGGFEVQR